MNHPMDDDSYMGYDTVDGPVVRAMEHVMILGSTMAPSMLHVR